MMAGKDTYTLNIELKGENDENQKSRKIMGSLFLLSSST